MKLIRRSAPVPALLLATVMIVAGFSTVADARPLPAPSAATQISRLREQAKQLEAELERLGSQAETVIEQYREVEDKLAEANAKLYATRQQVEATRKALDQAQSLASDRIVAIYQGRGTANPMGYLDANNVRELGVRDHYANAIAERDRSVIEGLGRQRQNLNDQEQALAAQRDQVAAQERQLATRRQQVETAVAQRKQALSQAKGQLAQLVEQERRRKAAEEARRAREAMARRAAQEALSKLPPPPAASPRASVAVRTAMDQIGKPYRWGANGPDAFDCSGLTSFAWRAAGVSLPHSSGGQKSMLPAVPINQLQPGDLVFYGHPVHHVGLYIGNGRMVNAPFTGSSVRVDSIYRSDFAGAGRPG